MKKHNFNAGPSILPREVIAEYRCVGKESDERS